MITGGITATPTVMMLAHIYDSINMLAFGLGGAKGIPPESMADTFIVQEEKANNNSDIETFATGEEFEARRKELLKKLAEQDEL